VSDPVIRTIQAIDEIVDVLKIRINGLFDKLEDTVDLIDQKIDEGFEDE
jgi:hypothetical protein